MAGTRSPSWRRIRLHRNYTVDEAARALGVAKGTVRRWLKVGLPSIADRRPLLILGVDLVGFLRARRAKKATCRLDECYCFSCRAPRRPAFNAVEFIPLTSKGGNLRALCEECSTVMHKRVSTTPLRVLLTNSGRDDDGGTQTPK